MSRIKSEISREPSTIDLYLFRENCPFSHVVGPAVMCKYYIANYYMSIVNFLLQYVESFVISLVI